MTTAQLDVSEIDVFSDEARLDPYPVYDALRSASPVLYMPKYDVWAVTGHAEARQVLGDWQTFTSTDGVAFNQMMNELAKGTFLTSDPPRHDEMRAIFSRGISPKAMRGVRDIILNKAAATAQKAVEMGSFDGVTELAQPFAVEVVSKMIGFPQVFNENILAWSDAGWNCSGPQNERFEASITSIMGMNDFLIALKPEDCVPGGLAAETFAAARAGELDEAQVVPMLMNYTVPAMDTTIAAISHAFVRFAQNPDQWDAVREDPSLIPGAINEVLRMDASLSAFTRRVTKDGVEIGGVAVPKGAWLALFYGAANRDPRRYSDPGVFDIRRDASDHLTFGYGLHGCAGQSLARLEIQSLLEELAKRVTRLHIESPGPVRHINNLLFALEALPMRVDRV